MKDIIGTIAHPLTMLGGSLLSAIVLRHRPREVARFATAVPVGIAVGKVLKALISEPRPRPKGDTTFESFPSDHSLATAALAFSLVAARRSWWALPVAVAAIGIVNVSRVRNRDHWPHDVIAGDLIGLAAAGLGALAAAAVDRSTGA